MIFEILICNECNPRKPFSNCDEPLCVYETRAVSCLASESRTPTARRISAISIAERVAEEQCLGAKVGSLVGYQVRLDSATSKDTQLLFLTPGLLLRKLQSSPMLSEYTHIVIDEVHERDKYTEFLLIRLRDLLPLRPDLRLVLMSATLQTEVLMNYFAPSTANDS